MTTTGEPTVANGDSSADAHAAGGDIRLGLTATSVGMVLFATGPVLVAGADLEGLAVAMWRAWIAFAVFGAVVALQGKVSWTALRLTAPPGLAFGLGIGLFFSAAQITSVANASLLTVMQPLPLLVAARFVFGEQVGRRDVAFMLLAIAGAAFMVLSADSAGTANIRGDLLAVGSTLAGASYFVLGKRARTRVETMPFMMGMMFWGGVALTPMVAIAGQDAFTADGSEWLRLAAVGVIPGIGHMFINYSHRSVPLVLMGLFQLLMPVAAALLALWFLDQSLTAAQVVGGLVVLAAISAHTIHRSDAERRARRTGRPLLQTADTS